MKIKKVLSILILVLLCLCVVGCSNEPEDKGYVGHSNKPEDKVYKDVTDLYTLTKNEDNTYSYSFSDLEGKILFENDKRRQNL